MPGMAEVSVWLLYGAVVVPALVALIGGARGRSIDAMQEVGLSAFGMVVAATLFGALALLANRATLAEVAPVLLAAAGTAAMAAANGVNFRRLGRGGIEADFQERGGGFASRGGGGCAAGIFLDPGKATDWDESGNTGLLSAMLPGNAYFYWLEIDFTVEQTSLTVDCSSRASLRPWYGWFAMSLISYDRTCEASAVGVVTCEEGEGGCRITGVGNTDNESDVECSAAAVVNAIAQPDPAKVLLQAAGAVTFAGQQAVQGITLGTQINAGTSGTSGTSTPAAGGGGTTSGASVTAGVQVSASVTIQMPTVVDKKKHLTRPVIYHCRPVEGGGTSSTL